MFKEIELGGHGYARGRNGGFVPRKVELYEGKDGELTLDVYSKREGGAAPIRLRLPRHEALELVHGLMQFLKPEVEPKVAVVLEGGLVQAFLSNRPDIETLVVDYDTDGDHGPSVKLVRQDLNGDKSLEPAEAFVTDWGTATLDERFTKHVYEIAS